MAVAGYDLGAQTAMALGIAASQPIGVREQFGSMTKAFHIGGAARAGLMSALMAKHGYTASGRAIEAPRGLAQTYSTKCDWNEITVNLGTAFEISDNTYKPFACGIVIHPTIDAATQLRAKGVTAENIERVELRAQLLQGLVVAPFALAELFLDGFQLLAQVEFALALRELPFHFGLDFAAQLEQFVAALAGRRL